MLYSKDDIVAAVREELAEANRECGIADGFTDDDYKYLGVIAAAWERLLIRQPNGSKPLVSGSLPEIPDWIIKYDKSGHQSSAGKAIRFLMDRVTVLQRGRQ